MNTNQNCKICRKPMNAFSMGEKNGFRLSSCKSCGSVTVTEPVITREGLEKYYGDIQPEVTHLPLPEREIEFKRRGLSKVIPASQSKSFLDVCALQGYGVKAAQELGFSTVKGLNPYEFYSVFAKKTYGEALFETAHVDDFAKSPSTWDFIYASEFFCVEVNLDESVAALSKLLSPSGTLYIEEQDGNSFWLPKTFTRWGYADPPLNFNYVSFDGLKALLERHGLYVQKKFFSLNPLMRLVVMKK